MIQRERKSLWDSYLVDFSFKLFSFIARCSLFILSSITCIECSEFSVVGSLTKVNVEGLLTKIGGLTFFFLSVLSFTDTDNSQDYRGREGTFFYSTLLLPPAHKHSDIYLQLCTWDDYHIFLIATLVFTRLLLDEIYHLIELLFDWLMMWYWFKFVCVLIWVKVLLQLLDMRETGRHELALTNTLLLQANRLTKCASLFVGRWFKSSSCFLKAVEKDRRLAASSVSFWHYICCTVETGKHTVKKEV